MSTSGVHGGASRSEHILSSIGEFWGVTAHQQQRFERPVGGVAALEIPALRLHELETRLTAQDHPRGRLSRQEGMQPDEHIEQGVAEIPGREIPAPGIGARTARTTAVAHSIEAGVRETGPAARHVIHKLHGRHLEQVLGYLVLAVEGGRMGVVEQRSLDQRSFALGKVPEGGLVGRRKVLDGQQAAKNRGVGARLGCFGGLGGLQPKPVGSPRNAQPDIPRGNAVGIRPAPHLAHAGQVEGLADGVHGEPLRDHGADLGAEVLLSARRHRLPSSPRAPHHRA